MSFKLTVSAALFFLLFLLLIPNIQAKKIDLNSDQQKLESVQNFLRKQTKFRIFVEFASGNGHQSSNIRFMQRLRELGFKGTFEIILDERFNNASKMEVLVPGFKAALLSKKITTLDTLGKVEIDTLNNFKNRPNETNPPITLLGSYDASIPREDFKAKDVILLQPMNWLGPRIVIHNDRSIELLDLSQSIQYLGISPESDLSMSRERLYSKGLKKLKRQIHTLNKTKVENLEWLSSHLNDFHVLTTYSMDFTENYISIFEKTIKALQQVAADKGQAPKPILLLSLDNFQDIRFEKLKSLAEKLNIEFKNINQQFSKSDKMAFKKPRGSINLIQIGPLPTDLFHSFLLSSNFPVFIEGQNAKDFMLKRGLPFINTQGNTDIDLSSAEKSHSLLNESPEKIKFERPDWTVDFDDVFFRSNPNEPDIKKLSEFYKRSLAKDPSIYDRFSKFRQKELFYKNDPVLIAFWNYMSLRDDKDSYLPKEKFSFSNFCEDLLKTLISPFRRLAP